MSGLAGDIQPIQANLEVKNCSVNSTESRQNIPCSSQNIPCCSNELIVGRGSLAIVIRYNLINSVLASTVIVQDIPDLLNSGLLHFNQTAPDYCATDHDIGNLEIHNLDTGGDRQLDLFDEYRSDACRD